MHQYNKRQCQNNTGREKHYEMALQHVYFMPERVRGFDEFKPEGARYNPSRIYNLHVTTMLKGYRMLGVNIIGDIWTDPRTPAGRSMGEHYSDYLRYAGRSRQDQSLPPSYRPIKRLGYEQLAQQLGSERIKQNTLMALENGRRFRAVINLKIKYCIDWEMKSACFDKRDRLDAVYHELLKAIGKATNQPLMVKSVGTKDPVIITFTRSQSIPDELLGIIATRCFQLYDMIEKETDETIGGLFRNSYAERKVGKKQAPNKTLPSRYQDQQPPKPDLDSDK